MSPREAFGTNLRRARLKADVLLEDIARQHNIGLDYLEALEANDFRDWPTGIYARAWVKAYAESVGLDPHTTVDDFCRWFPHGDRRADRLLRETAELVGHDPDIREELLGTDRDRRLAPPPAPTRPARSIFARLVARLADARTEEGPA